MPPATRKYCCAAIKDFVADAHKHLAPRFRHDPQRAAPTRFSLAGHCIHALPVFQGDPMHEHSPPRLNGESACRYHAAVSNRRRIRPVKRSAPSQPTRCRSCHRANRREALA